MTQTNATLALNFAVQDERTILRVQKQEPPLRVVRAFPIETITSVPKEPELANASAPSLEISSLDAPVVAEVASISPQPVQLALVHLQNVSGGVLGGDQLHLDVTVEANAQVQLTTTGSTRVYRHRAGYPITQQTTQLTVGSGALLEYLPDTLIPYASSQYRQSTSIHLADGAGLFYWEVVTPGREAKGELFEYDLLQIELDIVAKGQPIAIERSRMESETFAPSRAGGNSALHMSSPARLGIYRYFSTFYICRVGVEKQLWLDLEAILDEEARALSARGETMWGVSTLPAHGLSVRAVGTSCHAIQQGLPRFWQLAKAALYGHAAVMPRKMY